MHKKLSEQVLVIVRIWGWHDFHGKWKQDVDKGKIVNFIESIEIMIN